MSHVFPLKEPFKITNKNIFKSRNVCTVTHGTESLAHLDYKILAMVPDDIKVSLP